jgi:hypothetical protein
MDCSYEVSAECLGAARKYSADLKLKHQSPVGKLIKSVWCYEILAVIATKRKLSGTLATHTASLVASHAEEMAPYGYV